MGAMTSVTSSNSSQVAAQSFAAARRFLDVIATRDFAQLSSASQEDIVMRALLPPGPAHYECVAAVRSAFSGWFGSPSEFDLLDAAVDQMCDRLRLRWRVRIGNDDGRCVIEQHAYATPGPDGRCARLDVLCSGFRPQVHDD